MQQSKVISFHFSGFLLPKTPRRHFFFRQENSGHLKLFLPVGLGAGSQRPPCRPVYSLVSQDSQPSSLMGEGEFFSRMDISSGRIFWCAKNPGIKAVRLATLPGTLANLTATNRALQFGKMPGFEGLAYALLRSPSRSRSPQFPV